jgi:hypothetical protein
MINKLAIAKLERGILDADRRKEYGEEPPSFNYPIASDACKKRLAKYLHLDIGRVAEIPRRNEIAGSFIRLRAVL